MAEDLSNVLSQEEVDAMFKAVSSGEMAFAKQDDRKVCVTYDFRNPVLIPKEVVRILRVIHENFARNAALSLSAFFRHMVQVELISVDQLTYNEFMLSLPPVTHLDIVSFSPLKGNVVMEVNVNMMLLFVERLLGGDSKKSAKPRQMTEMEMAVSSKVIKRILRDYASAWQHIMEFEPRIESRSTDPRFAQICKPEEIVLLVCFDIKMGEATGILNICFPLSTFEPLIDLIVKLRQRRRFGAGDGFLTEMQKELLQTPLVCRAELDRFSLSYDEITSLRVGDVLRLKRKLVDGADLAVEHKPAFRVALSAYKQRKQAVVQEKYED